MHLPRPFRALLAAPLLLVLAAPPAGAVSVDQTFKVPASGRFTINGHGFGHGHGMSQYGAQGAALQGLGYRKIVKFYYPGTRFSTYSGNIAVLITSDTTRDVQVRVRPGLRVKDRGTGTVYRLPTRTGVKKWRLKISQRRTWVQFHNSTGWHTWRLPNGRWRLVGDGEFSSPAHLLTLVTPSGPKVLRGTLRGASAAPAGAVSDTVNVLPIDDYVQGVVAAEMPASWRPAALKAQAVAARTYALFERAANLNSWYQICDTTACQVYGGVASEYSTTDAAVRDTAGRYLSWHGQPAFTQFSASSGGWTSAGSQPYLPHQQDPYDGFSGNGVHTWSVRVSAAPLERRYPSIGTLRRVTVTQREGGGQWQGRVWAITLRGSKGSARISGTDLQSVYRLRSTWFQLGR